MMLSTKSGINFPLNKPQNDSLRVEIALHRHFYIVRHNATKDVFLNLLCKKVLLYTGLKLLGMIVGFTKTPLLPALDGSHLACSADAVRRSLPLKTQFRPWVGSNHQPFG